MKEPNHDITPQEQMAEAMQAERPGEAQPAAPKEEKPSLWIECYTLLHDLVYILVFVTILFVFALRVVSVSGPSMYPTLVDRDYVALLSNVFYSGSDIQNGDVVVALAPRFDDEPIVKRVIATAGQTVDIDFTRGIVYVDGAARMSPTSTSLPICNLTAGVSPFPSRWRRAMCSSWETTGTIPPTAGWRPLARWIPGIFWGRCFL